MTGVYNNSDVSYVEREGDTRAMQPDSKSPFDAALFHMNETVEELSKRISMLAERLEVVSNNHPRPESPNEAMMKDSHDVSGDSPLLSQVNILHRDLAHLIERVTVILGKLDI